MPCYKVQDSHSHLTDISFVHLPPPWHVCAQRQLSLSSYVKNWLNTEFMSMCLLAPSGLNSSSESPLAVLVNGSWCHSALSIAYLSLSTRTLPDEAVSGAQNCNYSRNCHRQNFSLPKQTFYSFPNICHLLVNYPRHCCPGLKRFDPQPTNSLVSLNCSPWRTRSTHFKPPSWNFFDWMNSM